MRHLRLVLLLFAACALAGCLMSEQEGERSHANSPPPERMAFHYDSGLNRGIVWGRSAALVLLGLWIASLAGKEKKLVAIGLGTLPCVGLAGWLLVQGLGEISGYRIDVETDRLVVRMPGEEQRDFYWEQIDELWVEGTAYELGGGLPTFEEYDTMELRLTGGESYVVDLTRLSVEQRGTLWQAVVRKAQMIAAPR